MSVKNLDIEQEIYEIENFWKNLISLFQCAPNSVFEKKRNLILLPFRLIFGSPYNN